MREGGEGEERHKREIEEKESELVATRMQMSDVLQKTEQFKVKLIEQRR